MDTIVDHDGLEIFCDMRLANNIIYYGLASCIQPQLKADLTFLSDAMEEDVK